MSPTVLREAGYRFYFFSREETRMHVHVQAQNGEANYWPELGVDLSVDAIRHPERFPLSSHAGGQDH